MPVVENVLEEGILSSQVQTSLDVHRGHQAFLAFGHQPLGAIGRRPQLPVIEQITVGVFDQRAEDLEESLSARDHLEYPIDQFRGALNHHRRHHRGMVASGKHGFPCGVRGIHHGAIQVFL
jgi:hypothetical protein